MKDIKVGNYIMYFTASTIELKEERVKEPYLDYFARIEDIGKDTITIKSYLEKHPMRISMKKILSYVVISREEYKKLRRKL